MFALLRSLVYAAGFVLLWTWVALQARQLDSGIGVELPPWLAPAGIVIGLAGALLTAACIASFALRGRGTPAPFDAPRALVAVGPYRWLRNPMYVGAAGIILGAGLFIGSAGVSLLSVAFLLFFHVFVRVYEEPRLERVFGDSYRDYRRRVHRWLPGWPATTPSRR